MYQLFFLLNILSFFVCSGPPFITYLNDLPLISREDTGPFRMPIADKYKVGIKYQCRIMWCRDCTQKALSVYRCIDWGSKMYLYIWLAYKCMCILCIEHAHVITVLITQCSTCTGHGHSGDGEGGVGGRGQGVYPTAHAK